MVEPATTTSNNLFIHTSAAASMPGGLLVMKDCPEDEKKLTSEELMAGGIGLLQVTNCFEMAQKVEYKLGTGCKIINDYLRGGFLPKKIYEIYGESGTGKT